MFRIGLHLGPQAVPNDLRLLLRAWLEDTNAMPSPLEIAGCLRKYFSVFLMFHFDEIR
jgi:hypothetical protein